MNIVLIVLNVFLLFEVRFETKLHLVLISAFVRVSSWFGLNSSMWLLPGKIQSKLYITRNGIVYKGLSNGDDFPVADLRNIDATSSALKA